MHLDKNIENSSEMTEANPSKLTRAMSGAMALILAAGSTVPAFASDVEAESETAIAVVDDGADATPAPSLPSADVMVNQTVPLTPKGEQVTESSTVPQGGSADSAAPSANESEAKDTPEDNETCLWTRDGNVWSTTRGGSPMTVTNAFAFGIDVSEWQGDIDWTRVKASGVQYAILRCAYGSAASGHEDRWFAENVQGCKDNGIPFGVYLYSNSTTAEGGLAEAQHALDIMERAGATPQDLMFPVYYDIEDKVHRELSAEARGDLAEAFCNAIEGAGYVPGIYASQSWLDNLLTDARFDNWTKWAASYPAVGAENATSSYTSAHDMWQCMSRGEIDGISTRVDINFDYRFSEGYYSAVYDYEYYLKNNPDLYLAFGDDRIALFAHFMKHGMAEGRISSPNFNLHGYFNANADLRRIFGLDLQQYYLHYVEAGQYEGRSMEDSMTPKDMVKGIHVMDLSAIYDPYVYLANYADLRDAFTMTAQGYEYIDDAALFRHFINDGINEGRVAK